MTTLFMGKFVNTPLLNAWFKQAQPQEMVMDHSNQRIKLTFKVCARLASSQSILLFFYVWTSIIASLSLKTIPGNKIKA